VPVVLTGDVRRTAARAGGAPGTGSDALRWPGAHWRRHSLADPWLCGPGCLDLIEGAGAGDPKARAGGLTQHAIRTGSTSRQRPGRSPVSRTWLSARLTRFAKRRRSQPPAVARVGPIRRAWWL